MSDLIEEIKEDATVEQLLNFLKKYKKHLLIFFLSIVCAGSGYGIWSYFHEKNRHAMASKFEKALEHIEKDQTIEAVRLLDELHQKDPKEGYGLLAAFRALAVLKEGSPEQTALYKKIINHPQIESKFRELAVILWGYESLETLSANDLSFLGKELEKIEKGRGPWVKSAQELLALIDIQRGAIQSAIKRLGNLVQDENAPSALRQRAFAFIEHFGYMR